MGKYFEKVAENASRYTWVSQLMEIAVTRMEIAVTRMEIAVTQL